MKHKVETVTVDRIKPAHLERKPEKANTTQRQTNPKPKYMIQRPAAIVRKLRTARARYSSINTPKSFRTGVNMNISTRTRPSTLGVGTSPAIALQSDATRARLPRPSTLYKAQHSRTTIASRTNRQSGSFLKYSRITLHLRSSALDRSETNKRTDVRRSKNTAHSGKAKADNTIKQKRVGRTIHTPARFVQLVHMVVAPNNIYGGPAARITVINL